MTRKIVMLMFVLLMVGCGREAGPRLLSAPVPDQQLPSSRSGVSLEIFDVRPADGGHVIIYELANGGSEPLDYGGHAALEKKMEDGWHGVIYSDAVFYRDPGFRDFGKTLQPRIGRDDTGHP